MIILDHDISSQDISESFFAPSFVEVDEILGRNTPGLKSLGSQEEIRSVMAAFRKRFLAVLPENSNLRGWPRRNQIYQIGIFVVPLWKSSIGGAKIQESFFRFGESIKRKKAEKLMLFPFILEMLGSTDGSGL